MVSLKPSFAAAVALLLSACRTGSGLDGSSSPSTTGQSSGSTSSSVAKEGVGVATFNVRRFFDTSCDSGDCGTDAWEELPSETEFAARVEQIAVAIEQLDSDVILLQEIETQVCLDALATRLAPRFPIWVHGEIGTAATVDVAVLSAGELLMERRHRDEPLPLPGGGTTTFAREFLELHLQLDGQRLIVFSAHFKSKANDQPERRLAEAVAAQRIVTEVAAEHPEALVVLGGDLNDTPGSPPIDAIELDGELQRVAAELPQGHDSTFVYGGQQLALDHLYLAVAAAGGYLAGSAKVVRDNQKGLGGSDHAALRARFSLPGETN